MIVTEFDLATGADIRIPDVGAVRQPTLREIRDMGYEEYLTYLRALFVTWEDVRDELRTLEDKYDSVLDLLMQSEPTRELLWKALSFFMRGSVGYAKNASAFVVLSEDGSKAGEVNAKTFETLQYVIRRINYVPTDEEEPKTFRNAAAKRIWEKLKAGRKLKAKTEKSDPNLTLANVTSTVAAKASAYNWQSVLGLTVFQIYDVFFRSYADYQTSVIGQRWAAWGKEDFDFTVWYRNLNHKT